MAEDTQTQTSAPNAPETVGDVSTDPALAGESAPALALEPAAAAQPLAVPEVAAETTPPKSGRKPRRGPPPAGEAAAERFTVILTTSRYQDGQGGVLRRGRPVNVPEHRLDGLLLKGKVRVPARGELERALKAWPAVDLF